MSTVQVGLADRTGKLDPHLFEATAVALNREHDCFCARFSGTEELDHFGR
jgi:hypothetical protein